MQEALLILRTAYETFFFVEKELGENSEMPWPCYQSKALEVLIGMRSSIPDVSPADMARAVARFREERVHPDVEPYSYRKALLGLVRKYFAEQDEALSFLQSLAEVDKGNWNIRTPLRNLTAYIEAGHSPSEDEDLLSAI